MQSIANIVKTGNLDMLIQKIEEIDRAWLAKDYVRQFLDSFGIDIDKNDVSIMREFYDFHNIPHRGIPQVIYNVTDGIITKDNNIEYIKQKEARRLEKIGIPARFRDATLENFDPQTANQSRILAKCRDYIKSFDGHRGIMLIGQYGRGKTHLLIAILKEIAKTGVTCRYCNMVDVYDEMRQAFAIDHVYRQSPDMILNRLINADLLFIDDIGKEKISEWTLETQYRLIDGRYSKNKATLIASNITEDEYLKRCVDESWKDRTGAIFSRIAGMCDVYEIDGPDYRRKS